MRPLLDTQSLNPLPPAGQLAVYVATLALVATFVGFATATVATTVLRLVELHVIDGSGHQSLIDRLPAEGETLIRSTTAPVEATAGPPEPPKPRPVPAGLITLPSDNPESDPAASYHRGDVDATYRTYCVRLCDGYFWPVSFSTTTEHFDRDGAVCNSSCSSPARLFVHKMPGGGPGNMVALDGVRYASLRTAFLFRATYLPECTCKPQPWQQEAKDRHRLYAAAAAAGRGDKAAAIEARALAQKVAVSEAAASARKSSESAVAARELSALARATDAKPLAGALSTERAAQKAEARIARADRRGDNSTIMRLGALQATSANTSRNLGWKPANGNSRPWRERVFSGN